MKNLFCTAIVSVLLVLCAAADGQEFFEGKRICGRIEIIIAAVSGEKTLSAVLYDNSSARALLEKLAGGGITLNMNDYGGFEKVADLGFSLPQNDTPTDTDAGDLILYLGRRFVIYYDKNSWNFTPLGKIEAVSKSELQSILGDGSVRVTIRKQEPR